MVTYEVRFNDWEVFSTHHSLEEAREVRARKNFNYFSRSLHIYKVSTHDGQYDETKIV